MKRTLFEVERGGRASNTDRIEVASLLTLSKQRASPAISVVLPTNRSDSQLAPARFQALLDEACRTLGSKRPPAISRAMGLRTDAVFWSHQAQTLAVFACGEEFFAFRLNCSWPQRYTVGERFYILPLVREFNDNQPFLALVVTKESCALFEGNAHELRRFPALTLPRHDEYLAFPESEREGGLRTQVRSSGPGTEAIPFGHGTQRDQAFEKDVTAHYLREIARRVGPALQDRIEPLFLVGPEHLLPLYRPANVYQHLQQESIQGDYQDIELKDLHRMLLPLAAKYREREDQRRINRITETPHRDLVVEDIESLLPAASSGAVDSLLLEPGVRYTGRYVADTESVSFEKEGDELVNVAAAEVIRHRGHVSILEQSELPLQTRSGFVALLRYALPVRATPPQQPETEQRVRE